MDFALVPDKGPPRLLRFVQSAQMPSDSTLFLLDRPNNVLLINNHLYGQLDDTTRQQVLRTHLTTHELTREFA